MGRLAEHDAMAIFWIGSSSHRTYHFKSDEVIISM
jgi:hypothetical protein